MTGKPWLEGDFEEAVRVDLVSQFSLLMWRAPLDNCRYDTQFSLKLFKYQKSRSKKNVFPFSLFAQLPIHFFFACPFHLQIKEILTVFRHSLTSIHRSFTFSSLHVARFVRKVRKIREKLALRKTTLIFYEWSNCAHRFNFEVCAKEGKTMTSCMRIDFPSLGAWRAQMCVRFFFVYICLLIWKNDSRVAHAPLAAL